MQSPTLTRKKLVRSNNLARDEGLKKITREMHFPTTDENPNAKPLTHKKKTREKYTTALDEDWDGFFKVEEAKQMKVVLCVLPNALPLTLEKPHKILENILGTAMCELG